jgi:hypothetical protein
MKKGAKKTISKKKSETKKESLKNNSLIINLLIIFSAILVILIIYEVIIFLIWTQNHQVININYNNLGELGSSSLFGIKNPTPNGSIVTFFVGESRIFNISNDDFQSVNWYLDSKNIRNDTKSIELKGLSVGNHTLEVRIANGTQIDSKMWMVDVEDDEKVVQFVFDVGSVMFWVIIIILIIIMFLLAWLIYDELVKKKRSIKLDVMIVGEEEPVPGFVKKKDMSKRFNIPGG